MSSGRSPPPQVDPPDDPVAQLDQSVSKDG